MLSPVRSAAFRDCGIRYELSPPTKSALYLAVHEMRKPKMRMGTIDPHCRVHWKDGEPEHPRVRYVVLTEREDLSRRVFSEGSERRARSRGPISAAARWLPKTREGV
jgi:hypothetical protein